MTLSILAERMLDADPDETLAKTDVTGRSEKKTVQEYIDETPSWSENRSPHGAGTLDIHPVGKGGMVEGRHLKRIPA
ncbi:MAG: hypothetical protein R6X27_13460 [Candidatus Desulfacyla sp.]